MNIYDIINYTSILFWLIIGIRQFKGTWGWFFMINGLTGLVALLLVWILGISPDRIFLTYAFLISCSLFYKFFNKHKFILIPLGFTLFFPALYLEHTTINSFLSLSYLIILLFFTRLFILSLFSDSKINLFYLATIQYALIGVLKLNFLIVEQWAGIDLYMLSTIFQALITAPFLFIMHDDKRLSIKLGKK